MSKSTLKVIFLDCDGVLANYRSQMMEVSPGDSGDLIFDCNDEENKPLEKSCLANLQWLATSANAKVVLTSTWRLERSMRNFLVNTLQVYGIDVVGDTPASRDGRGAEVRAWLSASQAVVEGFVILDDDHESSFQQHGLIDRFVQTEMYGQRSLSILDPSLGLTRAKAEEALHILKRPLQ
jgi:hypothetical protein